MRISSIGSRRLLAGPGGLLVLLVVVTCSPADSPVPAHGLAGDYTRDHRVWVFHGNEPVEVEVADRLLITGVDGTSLSFQLELLGDNGRQCQLEGLAKRNRDLFAYVKPGVNGACELRFQPAEGLIVVTDVRSRCSAAQCDQPHAIDHLSFTAGPRTARQDRP